MEIFENYVVAVILAVCLCVGYVLKRLFPSGKIDRFIPLIMAVLGIYLNVWMNYFDFTPEILLGGLASGLASTGMHQMFKQFIEGGKK